MKNKLAVISCFFNPSRYLIQSKNCELFRKQFEKAGIDYYIIELCYDGISDLPSRENIYKIFVDSKFTVMWQKERLLNILIDKISLNYEYICISDCDIIINKINTWADKVIESFDGYNIVQPYATTSLLKNNNKIDKIKMSKGWAFSHKYKQFLSRSFHPGHMIAFESNFIQKQKLYDYNIIGGGDFSFFSLFSIYDEFKLYVSEDFDKIFSPSLKEWVSKSTRQKINYVDGSIIHLYHGKRRNRRYKLRNKIIARHNFNPVRDVQICKKSGVFKWSEDVIENRPDLINEIKNYFKTRREDDII
jgi:hypothetical protein